MHIQAQARIGIYKVAVSGDLQRALNLVDKLRLIIIESICGAVMIAYANEEA